MFNWFKRRKVVEFSNSTKYWKDRYMGKGNSGAGSYNKLAQFKADILNDFVVSNNVDKVNKTARFLYPPILVNAEIPNDTFSNKF